MYEDRMARVKVPGLARWMGGQVAAELKRMQTVFCGEPANEQIDAYEHELLELYAHGYLGEVTYGCLRGGRWFLAFKYRAQEGGSVYEVAGARAEVSAANGKGLLFSSVLLYSPAWERASEQEREEFRARIGVKRRPAPDGEPGPEKGGWRDSSKQPYAGLGVVLAGVELY